MIVNFWRRACVVLSLPFLLVLGAGGMLRGGSTPSHDANPIGPAASVFVFELDGRIELPPPMPSPVVIL